MQPLWKKVWQYLKKLSLQLPCDPAILFQGICPKEMKTYINVKNLYVNVNRSIIHGSPKMLTTEMSIKRWTDKHNMVYPYKEILFGNKKKYWKHFKMNLENMLSKRSQTQKVIYYVISLTLTVQNRQNHQNRKLISSCQSLRGRGNGE